MPSLGVRFHKIVRNAGMKIQRKTELSKETSESSTQPFSVFNQVHKTFMKKGHTNDHSLCRAGREGEGGIN